ncbi:MAG: AraC family transcriptional regulator [Campylobacterota bacterium]|nr:AraC family transcriptional regulator [Campylobacterota bacterium]
MNLKALENTYFENIKHTNRMFSKHFHDTYTIGITHDGLFKSTNLNKTVLSYKHSTRIINPNELHGGSSNAWNYTNFYPSVELFSQIYEDMFGLKHVPLFEKHIVDDAVLYNLLLRLFRSVYAQEVQMKIEILLINAVSYLIKNYTHATKEYTGFFDAPIIMNGSIEYINDMLDSTITLDDLAHNAQLSKYHFLRVFKKHMGITPHNYILNQRIYKATKSIIEGDRAIDASINSGFSDQSHFNRNFKKVYGYSPKTLFNKSNIILYK